MPLVSRLSLIAFVVVAACSAKAGASPEVTTDVESAESRGQNDLSPEQKRLVLTLLDDACSDAWCEGDYAWRFEAIRCSFPTSCTLGMRVVDPATDAGPERTFSRSCTLRAKGYSAFVETAPNGFTSLTAGMFEEVTACVDRVTPSIPRR